MLIVSFSSAKVTKHNEGGRVLPLLHYIEMLHFRHFFLVYTHPTRFTLNNHYDIFSMLNTCNSAPIAIWVHLMYSAQIIKQRLQELTLAPPTYIRVTHIRGTLYHGAILRQCQLQRPAWLLKPHALTYIRVTHIKGTLNHGAILCQA